MSTGPKRKKDWVGREVELIHETETKGGTIFPAGTRMRVTRNFGGLWLEAVTACEKCKLKYRHRISKVHEMDVRLLPLEEPT
jgi:hypothetical protein